MLLASVVVLLCYSWLAAHGLERKFEAPPAVASNVAWLIRGETRPWADVQAFKWSSSERIQQALLEFARALPLVGGFRQAPEIVIDADHEDRYTIGDERIQISESIAVADGQLIKALLKVWILQRALPEYSSSLLRMEVISDLLTAMVTGRGSLVLPGGARTAVIPPAPDGWLRFAKSFASSCGSVWESFELAGVCGESQNLNALSFRPFFDGMIWDIYQRVHPFDRYAFLRSWSRSLRVPLTERTAAPVATAPANLVQWRDWLDSELACLLPARGFGATSIVPFAASVQPSLDEAALRAGLRTPVTIALAIHRAGREPISEQLEGTLPGRAREPFAVSLEGGGAWLVTGRGFGQSASWIRIANQDLAQFEAPLTVWQGCAPPTLGRLLDFPVKSDRLLYVQSCTEKPSKGWKSLLVDGLGGFARSEPATPFLQLHRMPLTLALARGQLDLRESIASYMTTSPRGDRSLLGLTNAEWRREMLAYRVTGAIEAVEWFRSM